MSEAARRRLSLQGRRLCRFCLSRAEPLGDIYELEGPVPLPLQVMACVAIEVFPTDGMPSTICDVCRFFMNQSYKFKQICKQADEALRHYISQGELQEPIVWPKDLLEKAPARLIEPEKGAIFDGENTSVDSDIKLVLPPKIKSVGRPRKQSSVIDIVPADKEEMVHNIKVTQRGDEVIISTEEEDDGKKPKYYMIKAAGDKPRAKPKMVPTGVFPCQQCERSFPLEQLRDMHEKSHSRERPFSCKICDKAYFTKYDLQKHEETHSNVKPHTCTVCDKSFLRLTLLQRHQKIHTTVPRYACSECEHTFLTEEELNSHNVKRHSKSRPHACDSCPKKFAFKQGLERHYMVTHSRDLPFKCDYCHQSFGSSNRLQRHITSHAGMRPYPCKFCPKAFLLSHHYTRHLRSHHIGKSVKTEGVFGRQQDNYKCIQCDEIFKKPDDLIYHSAVHATQDLTCPLCKEKFLDVDAVTMHIKSHNDGEQYICEWCDLVFATEDKLDMHIDMAHQEAIAVDVFNEISLLEKRLLERQTNEEGEDNQQMNSTDEEYDEMYESTQQAEKEKSQIEIEVTADGEIKITAEAEALEDIEHSDLNTEEPSELTYTELKTVTPDDFINSADPESSQPIETAVAEDVSTSVEPDAVVENKVSTIIKAAPRLEVEKKSFTQRLQEQKFRRIGDLKKEIVSETPVISRTNEKSLILLEKDIRELTENAKNGNSPITSGRFISTSLTPRDKLMKTSMSDFKEKQIPKSTISHTKDIKSEPIRKYELSESPGNTPAKRGRPGRPPKKEIIEEEESDSSISEGNYSDAGDTSLIRRSARPNKVKDYAALIRDGERQIDSDNEDNDDDDDVDEDELEEREYKPPAMIEKKIEVITPGKRKRGRPRKYPLINVGPDNKKSKFDDEDLSNIIEKDESLVERFERPDNSKSQKRRVGRPSNKALQERANELGITLEELKERNRNEVLKRKSTGSTNEVKPQPIYAKKSLESSNNSLYSPSSSSPSSMSSKMKSAIEQIPGGRLVKTLPPGVKPVPLPPGKGVPPGVCQMRIGEKVVRVQKIVMTKAEVNAITKKGLIEMKDGAMILKAGVKLPTSADNKLIKKTLLNSEDPVSDLNEFLEASTSQKTPSSMMKEESVPKPTRYSGDNSDDDDDAQT